MTDEPNLTPDADPPTPPQWPSPPPAEQQPAPGAVHPLTVGRAFSLGWHLFRFRWRSLLGVTALVMLPAYLLQAAATIAFTNSLDRWFREVQPDRLVTMPDLQSLPPFPWDALVMSLGVGVLVALAGLIAGAAVIHIIGWTYGGGSASAGGALRATLNRLASLVGAGILVVLAVAGVMLAGMALVAALALSLGFNSGLSGLLALVAIVATIVAVIFIGLRLSFYAQSVMLEGQGATGSLRRSWRLVTGSTWRVLGYVLLLALVLFVAGLIVGALSLAIFGLDIDPLTGSQRAFDPVRLAAQSLLPAIAVLPVTPFYMAVTTLLYYDLRFRQGEAISRPPA